MGLISYFDRSFSGLDRLFNDFDHLFSDLEYSHSRPVHYSTSNSTMKKSKKNNALVIGPFDIRSTTSRSTNEKYILDVIAPGKSHEDFNVSLAGRWVIVNSLEENETPEESQGSQASVSAQKYTLKQLVPPEYNLKRAVVSMSNGVMTIEVPASVTEDKEEVRQLKINH